LRVHDVPAVAVDGHGDVRVLGEGVLAHAADPPTDPGPGPKPSDSPSASPAADTTRTQALRAPDWSAEPYASPQVAPA
ncbi:hypothetical protein AB0A69_33360, partial [Streptomyces sp. NPDC045431]